MLITILREYQTRVTRNIVAGDQPNIVDDAISNEPQRTTLGELKVKKKVPQKSPAGRELPSRNLQTDAAPSDAHPQQESGKVGYEGK